MVNPSQIFALIEQLERKIGLLKGMYDDAKQQLERLDAEKTDLNTKLKEQQNLVRQLQKKQGNSEKDVPKSKDFSKIVKDKLSETDTNAELKQQLDEYIRDLERCIAHLSSLS